MLKVYMDRGAKKQGGGVMCVASVAFRPFDYDRFLHAWEPMLRAWGASAFHATDFYPGGGEFKRKDRRGQPIPERMALFEQDSRRIPAIIGEHVTQLFVTSFRKDELDAGAPPNWRLLFGSLHRIASQLALSQVGFWATRVKYPGKIAYFYESGDEGMAQVDAAMRQMWTKPADREHTRMAATPIGVPKGRARGLEVADFLAWHWNKDFAERIAAENQPRRQRADITALMRLLRMREERIDVRLLAGRALAVARSEAAAFNARARAQRAALIAAMHLLIRDAQPGAPGGEDAGSGDRRGDVHDRRE